MHHGNRLLTAFVILIVVVGLHFALTSTNTTAQETTQTPANLGRYQISAWSHSASSGSASMHGAYIIDADSGKVWAIINDNKPKELGGVRE